MVTIWDQLVAPRFDQATEVLVVDVVGGQVAKPRTVLLAHASADELCELILMERADVLITGGIPRRYHEYLLWKKVEVLDSVMGPWEKALELLARGELTAETVLYRRTGDDSG